MMLMLNRPSRNDIRLCIEAVLGRVPDDALVDYHHKLGFRNCIEVGNYLRTTEEFRRNVGQASTRPMFLGDRVLAYTHRGDRIYLMPTDQDLTPSILERGTWEPHVEKAILQLVKPGDKVIEAGSNVGYHTLLMARAVGERGTVHAFEASPVLMKLLRSTLFQNGHCNFLGVGRVTLHHKAMTDREGTLTLQCAPDHFGSGHLVIDRPSSDFGAAYSSHFEVQAVAVDRYLPELPSIDFMHLDIEGAEPMAIRGAYQLIARSPGLKIVMEWALNMMSSMGAIDDVVAWLTAQGFRFWLIKLDGSGYAPITVDELMGLSHSDILISRQEPT
jgi:FkbM family methyltransferase